MGAAFRVGDRVRVTCTGTVVYISDGYAELGHDAGGIATFDPRQAAVELIRPEVKAGQVWQDALGRAWFVRAAADGGARQSYRFVCADRRVAALADSAFEAHWPDASLLFNPNAEPSQRT